MLKIKNKVSKRARQKQDTAEKKVSKLEDRPIGIIQTETQTDKRKKQKKIFKNPRCKELYKMVSYINKWSSRRRGRTRQKIF